MCALVTGVQTCALPIFSTASWILPNSLRIRRVAVASRALPTDFALVAICDCLACNKINVASAIETQKGREQPLPAYRSFITHLEIPAILFLEPAAQGRARPGRKDRTSVV